MTPGQLLRKQLRERPDFPILRSQTPLSVTLDPRLTHADRTLYDVVSFLQWPDNACHQSTRELADVASTDHHQAIRSLRRLFRHGHAKRNKDGSISLTSPVFTLQQPNAEPVKEVQSVPKCKVCASTKPIEKMGVCGACRRADSADAEVRGYLGEDIKAPPPYEMVYWGLKAHGSRCSAKELKRAYGRVTKPHPKAKKA